MPSKMAAKTTFCLYRQTVDSYAQMCCTHYHIIFSTFSLKFTCKCKICVQKVINSQIILKIIFWSCDLLQTYSFSENDVGLKNQITIILFKI